MLISAIGVFIVFALLSEYFLTFQNIMNLMQYSAVLGIAACGATICILSGSLDMSLGPIVALVSVYTARFLELSGQNVFLAFLGGIAVGALCGVVNGLLVTKVRIQPIIATLATMTIFQGIAYIETNGMSLGIFNPDFKIPGQGTFCGIPNMVWILIIIYAAWFFILKYTVFGRKLYAVGGNARASHLSGINIKKMQFLVFVIAGVMAGIAGTLYASLTGSGSPSSNSQLTLEAISAAVLGGISVQGGKGSLLGTLLGVLILGAISNGLVLINMGAYLQMIVKGCILLAAVGLDSLRTKEVG